MAEIPAIRIETPEPLATLSQIANAARSASELIPHLPSPLDQTIAEEFAQLLLQQAKRLSGPAGKAACGPEITVALSPEEMEFVSDTQALRRLILKRDELRSALSGLCRAISEEILPTRNVSLRVSNAMAFANTVLVGDPAP